MRMMLHTVLLAVMIVLLAGVFILEGRRIRRSRQAARVEPAGSTPAERDVGPALGFGLPLVWSWIPVAFSAYFLNPEVAIGDLILALHLVILLGRCLRVAELRQGRSGEWSLFLVAALAFAAGATA
ncbi:MAG: hypothetical protein ACRC0L_04050 [Angustibacter sp.]